MRILAVTLVLAGCVSANTDHCYEDFEYGSKAQQRCVQAEQADAERRNQGVWQGIGRAFGGNQQQDTTCHSEKNRDGSVDTTCH